MLRIIYVMFKQITGLNRPLSLASVYFFFAAIMVVICALITPPGQTPDELTHFARATQISQGGIIGLRLSPQNSGGMLPSHFTPGFTGFDDLPFQPQRHVDVSHLDALRDVHWNKERSFVGFANTVIYAPFTYLPGALTIASGRLTRMTVLQTSYAVRLVNGFLTILLCAGGIALARRGVLLLVLVASMPMTMALAASCSQDGVLIGLSILTVGILTRFNSVSEITTRNWIFITGIFAILAVSKPTLLFCSLIPAAFMLERKKLLAFLPFGASVCAIVIWSQIGIKPVKIQFLPEVGVSDSGQVHWLLTHITSIPRLAISTLRQNGEGYLGQWIGVLGWLDAPLPSRFYTLVFIMLAGAVLLPVITGRGTTTTLQTKL